MPKTLTATNVRVESLRFVLNDQGAVIGIEALVNVAYGEGGGVREQFDLWAELTATQRTVFQAIYNRLTQRLQAVYLA